MQFFRIRTLIIGIIRTMMGVKKYNPSLIQGSFTITDIDNKKNMQNNEIDKIIILFFILMLQCIILYKDNLF